MLWATSSNTQRYFVLCFEVTPSGVYVIVCGESSVQGKDLILSSASTFLKVNIGLER